MLRDAYKKCREMLENGGIEAADFEAQCLVEHITGYHRASQLAHGNDEISAENEERLLLLAKKRLEHVPLQYILGKWSFFGFDLTVGEGVLIPRDDTEVVVSLCLAFLKGKPNPRVLDLCAGSGAISIAIAKLANAEVTAVELSDKAFRFLEKNIELNSANVKAICGDIFECHKRFADGYYDLIVSNPPYIISEEIDSLQPEVRLEPVMALDGGADGYDFYRAITEKWVCKLKEGGALAFELGEGQADFVTTLMRENGLRNIRTEEDFGGVQRAIIGTLLSF